MKNTESSDFGRVSPRIQVTVYVEKGLYFEGALRGINQTERRYRFLSIIRQNMDRSIIECVAHRPSEIESKFLHVHPPPHLNSMIDFRSSGDNTRKPPGFVWW